MLMNLRVESQPQHKPYSVRVHSWKEDGKLVQGWGLFNGHKVIENRRDLAYLIQLQNRLNRSFQ